MEKHADQDLDYAEKLASPSRHPTSSNGGPSVQPDASSNEGGPYKGSFQHDEFDLNVNTSSLLASNGFGVLESTAAASYGSKTNHSSNTRPKKRRRGKHGAPNLSSRSAGNNLVGPTQPAIPMIGGKTLEARALHFLRFFCETDCGRQESGGSA